MRQAYLSDEQKLENPPIGHSFNNYQSNQSRNKPFVPRQRDDGEAGSEIPPPKKEYVDYDDPMTTQFREAQKHQQIVAGGIPKPDKQAVSYDDLF